MKMQFNALRTALAAALFTGSFSAHAVTYEAENYNSMFGVQFEQTNDIGGGLNAGWIDEGDYIEWVINVPQTGNYKLTARSAAVTTANVEIFIDGAYSAEIGIANTGGYTVWQSFTSSAFALTAGSHTLRVRFANGGQNLNWVQLDSSAANTAEALTTGLWRLASRADRNVLGRSGTNSFFEANLYAAHPDQHWRLVNRGGNNYDFKLSNTTTCLGRVSNAVALTSCNTASSLWTLDLLRARSVDRPAIYRLRSAQNTCLIPPGDVGQEPTIGTCGTNSRWYLEPSGFGERTSPLQYTIHGLVIVKPTTNFVNVAHNVNAQGTIPQSIVDAAQVSFTTGVKTWLERITDGRVTWVGTGVVANEPISSLSYDALPNTVWFNDTAQGNGRYMLFNSVLGRYEEQAQSFQPNGSHIGINFLPKPVDVPNDVQRYVPRGQYDTVQTFFTGGNVPGGWGWGPGRSVQSNHTLWTTIHGGETAASEWLSPNNEPTEVFIHEAMHGYDQHFSDVSPGFPLPDGGTHGGDGARYADYLRVKGWVHFYRDYWLGTVIGSDDTYRGYGPRAFSLPTVRQYALQQPESIVKITQATSNKCLTTQNGLALPAVGTSLVFSSNCSTDASSFVLQTNGMLRHKSSGYCVHPQGGTANNGTVLVLWNSCTLENHLVVGLNDYGSVQHTQTARCIHPQNDSATPADGTLAVYLNGCNQNYLRFRFNRP